MGRLSTHILDTTHGGPAAQVAIRLFSVGENRELLASVVSNADGRTDEALLSGDTMGTGTYELEFDVGEYFGSRASDIPDPPFLDTVLIRINLQSGNDYHVPLLASPWSYSTYRGS